MRRSLKLRSVWSTKILYIVVILASGIAESQTASVVNGIILQNQSTYAKIVPFGIVNVCISSSATCSAGNATIYTDQTGSVVKPQPVVADVNGNYSYYISSGCFTEQSSSPSGLYPFVRTVCSGGGGGSAVSFVKVPGIATIQTTVASVGGIAGVTPVWVEPTHSGSDPGPCPMTNPGAVTAGVGCFTWAQSNTAVTDFRFPGYITYFNPPATFSNFYSGEFLRSVFTASNLTGAHQNTLYSHATYLNGGINICQYGYCHLPWQANEESYVFSYTPGNSFGKVIWGEKHAPGDMVGLYSQVINVTAGRNAGGAEGAEAISTLTQQATVEYAGTVASVSGSQVTITVSQGEGLQGAGVWLVNTSGTDINTGTITSFNNNSLTAPATVSFAAGPTLTAVTVNTTLGTAVSAPGVATVTPAAMTGISANMYLAITDPKAFEIVKVTATTGSTFTATFAWPHQTTALVTGGGLVGFCFDPHGDDATNALYSQVTGTLHYVLPIVRNSTTTVDVWIANGSQGYTGYFGHAPTAGATYDIWPCARVVSVADPVQTAELSDTLTLEASGTLSLSSGNSVFLAHYFDVWTSGGQTNVQGFFPRLPGGQSGFFGNYYCVGLCDNSWYGLHFENGTPSAVQANAGQPGLFDVWPGWGVTFHYRSTPTGAVIWDRLDSTDILTLVQKATSTDIIGLYVDPTYNIFRFYDVSNSAPDIEINPILGSIVAGGRVTAAAVTTPNLAASGGAATLTNISTGAGTFGDYGNVLLYSQFDSAQLPALSGAYAYYCDHATFTANTGDVTDPSGGSTAVKMVSAASGSTCGSYASGTYQIITGLASNRTYTVSVYARGAVGGENFNLGIANLNSCNNGTISPAGPLTTSWVRYTCTINALSDTTRGFEAWTTTTSATIYLAFAQLEPRATAGVYAHTTTVAVIGSGLYMTGGIGVVTGAFTGNVTGNASTATALAATPGSATGQVVCWKASGVLGYCSSVVGAGGGCTCN